VFIEVRHTGELQYSGAAEPQSIIVDYMYMTVVESSTLNGYFPM